MKKYGAIAVIIIGVGMALSGARAFAETLSVELLLDPNIRVIDMAAPEPVTIIARPSQDSVTFRWTHDGVGELVGEKDAAGVQYVPPQDIKGDVMQTTVSVVVTDQDGNNATASVTFTLQRTPTPTPREEPSDGDYSVEDLKAKAKWNAWLNKQMRPAFEEAAALEQEDLDAADKREAWSRFLQNFAQNHPFSEEDDRMRQQAKERIAHWENDATPTPPPPSSQQGGEHALLLAKIIDALDKAGFEPALPLNQAGAGGCWENAAPGATCAEETTGMEFVYVPGGCFQMGRTETEKAQLIKEVGKENYEKYYQDELPRHEVCVKGFWMGKYEVTNAQYRRFKPDHKNYEYEGKPLNGDDQPVVMVSWNDAHAFTAWMAKQGRGEFRLPSEAEWEYAARGGTETIRSWGDDPKHTQACQYANVGDASFAEAFPTLVEQLKKEYKWFAHACDDGYAMTAPVGQFEPNAFGLYDMLGNVWEWCQDTYHENYNGAPTDGSAWGSLGDKKANMLLRGGSWDDVPFNVRSAYRVGNVPDDRDYYIGIRVVRVR